MNWKPYAVVAAAMAAAGLIADAPADWKASGLDDDGWWEYRLTEKPNSNAAKIEYFHYGTGEEQTIWLKREDDTLNFMRERTPRRYSDPRWTR
jgi:hypothetical protein